MTIKLDITDCPGGARVGVALTGLAATEIPIDNAVEALEDLARILGYTLVDREERRSLVELASEAAEDDNDYDFASEAWSTWQDRCEALSSAVLSALNTQEA